MFVKSALLLFLTVIYAQSVKNRIHLFLIASFLRKVSKIGYILSGLSRKTGQHPAHLIKTQKWKLRKFSHHSCFRIIYEQRSSAWKIALVYLSRFSRLDLSPFQLSSSLASFFSIIWSALRIIRYIIG